MKGRSGSSEEQAREREREAAMSIDEMG